MKKYMFFMLLALFLLSATYFLFFTGDDESVAVNVSIDNMPINRLSSSSGRARSEMGAKAVSNASFTAGEYKKEELPNKNDDTNASSFIDYGSLFCLTSTSDGYPVILDENHNLPNYWVFT